MVAITPGNILRHELIGLQMKISASSDPTLVGMKGTVIDETKKMLFVHDGDRSRMFTKGISTFRFRLPDGKLVLVDGKYIVGSPENRLKMRARSW
jgi:ribonuclease P protein subunit POP4